MNAEFHLFLPQMRMSMPDLVERARAAERSGFTGMALMDHFAPPLAESHEMWEAITTAGWLLSATQRLNVSHLVLCDTFRNPAMLAREAVTLDHASGGRFELGIGWGSVPAEFDRFGVSPRVASQRIARFKESLDVIRALWTGESVVPRLREARHTCCIRPRRHRGRAVGAPTRVSPKGWSRSGLGSRGRPSARSAMTLRCI